MRGASFFSAPHIDGISIPRLVAAMLAASVLLAGAARGEEPTGTPVEKTGTEGTSNAKSADSKTLASPGDKKDEKKDVGPGEQLSFRQSKVAAEMSELEERMYRLSEAIKALEPENSSRLMLGLKYAREELILHQMKETQDRLDKLALNEAAGEQKELLAKLQRLQDLLLSTDLDFRLQLERLRQLREILRRLDTAIKEEGREQKASDETAKKEQRLAALQKRRATLETLINRQTEHISQAEPLAKEDPLPESATGQLTKLKEAQEGTQKDTQALAEESRQATQPSLGSKDSSDAERLGGNVVWAASAMSSSTESLGKLAPKEALPPMRSALELLKKELAEVLKEQQVLEPAIAAEKFAAMKKDQNGNRQMTDGVVDLVRQQGDSASGALGELTRATGSMSGAESSLGKSMAAPASEDQAKAIASLKYAREQLQAEADKLLDQLRGEVKKRVIEGLIAMLEKQIAVRQSTVTLAPKAKTGSRQAVNSVVGLSKNEGAIIEVANELINLVEETEFGIALPAALGSVRDAMEDVKAALAKGDASEDVISAERQIEADLQSLMEAMKQLPSSKPPKGKPQKGSPDQERELNRLIAELKMVRLLQTRVNHDTLGVDGRRPPTEAELTSAIRKQIADLEGRQEDVRDVTERLSAERGSEIQGQ